MLRTYSEPSLTSIMSNIRNDPIIHGDELHQLFSRQDNIHAESVKDDEWRGHRRHSKGYRERLYAPHNSKDNAFIRLSILAREHSRVH